MLELYFGTDTITVRQKALAVAAKYVEAGARLERVESSVLSSGKIAEMLGAASLFGESTVFVLDMPSEEPEAYTTLEKSVAELAASSNTIIVIEGPLLAPAKKKWATGASVMEELTAGPQGARFDVFTLATALSQKDKKSLWLLLTKAKRAGLASEEIIGTLWWQLKTLRVAAITRSADEAGMKSYPYDKAKQALRNFKPGELETISRNLLAVYHEGHGGVKDIEVGLEEWVLQI
jgi:DNA polymerase III delta subunit